MQVRQILQTEFIPDRLSKQKLEEIGDKVCEWFEEDVMSRQEWENAYRKWIKLASQVMETKNFPWPNAANIKFPLVTSAAVQFNSRVVPALMPNSQPVGAEPVGADKVQRRPVAKAVADHMNYQLTSEIEEWEDDFDVMTMVLAITGQEFKKTYYSYEKRRIVSEYVSSADLVLHYWYNDFEATRKTQKIPYTYNELVEKMNMGEFVEYTEEELGDATNSVAEGDLLRVESDRRAGYNPSRPDDATPHLVLEHHGWYDLDNDGYAEPYRIVVHHASRKVLAITPRYTINHVEFRGDNKVVRIDPIESYTKFSLIPNPDGSQYSIGFGHLIAPLNHSVNTIINQLLDAGTLSNMQSGFIGKGVKIKGGVFKVQPGRFEVVPTPGDNLKNNIVPLPIREPSSVLMNLMVYLTDAAKGLSATSDMFEGQMPGQNTKAGVANAVREEGLKVFNSIYKRIRKAFKREMLKIFELNRLILGSGINSKVAASAKLFQVQPEFYDREALAIEPSADPNIALKEQRVQKAMGVLHLLAQFGGGNPQVAVRRVLEAMEVENIEELQQMPEPQPDPEIEFRKAELQMEMAKFQQEDHRKEVDQILKLQELLLKEKEEADGMDMDLVKVAADLEKASQQVQAQNARTNNSKEG